MSAITELPAHALADLVARGGVSHGEVARAFLDRVAALDPVINAVVTPNPALETDLDAATRRLAQGAPARPLEGVPFVVKDTIPVAGLRTTSGSLLHADTRPDESALSVQRMQAAGALLIGKTNTSEFATDPHTTNRLFGPTRNTVEPNHSPGGSSGGSAAAVAADMAPLALGTDFGGSVRIPAAWCGVTGLRPSPGRVPLYPTEFAWDTLVAHVQGPIARDVADIGLMLSVIAGQDDRDPLSLPDPVHDYTVAATSPLPPGTRFGLSETVGGLVPLDGEIRDAVRAAASKLERAGYPVDEATIDASDLREAIAGTRAFAIAARLGHLADAPDAPITDQVRAQVEDAMAHDIRSVARAERLRSRFYDQMVALLSRFELILTPTIGAPPFRLDAPLPDIVGGQPVARFYDVFLGCYAFSLAGLPAISVPCGYTRAGLPIGLQIVGHRLREDMVLRAAATWQAACPEAFTRRPIALDKAVPLTSTPRSPGMSRGL